jgi:DNA-binding winged helix-turn-helix (wHTH) protein
LFCGDLTLALRHEPYEYFEKNGCASLYNSDDIIAEAHDCFLQQVWGYPSMPFTRTEDVHSAWLRQKLEEDPKQPQWILTIHGHGYKFVGT